MKVTFRNYIVCLSGITEAQLDIIITDLQAINSDTEIWSINPSESLTTYAKKRLVVFRELKYLPEVVFQTSDQDIKLALPEAFALHGNVYFAVSAEITSDNYLGGCILYLSKLVKNKQLIEPDFPKHIFELYLYFKKNTFFVFDKSNQLLKGNAWEIDSFLIQNNRLRKNKLFTFFYRNLLLPEEINFAIKKQYSLTKNKNSLYPIADIINMNLKKLLFSCTKFITAVFILFTMAYNKTIRKF